MTVRSWRVFLSIILYVSYFLTDTVVIGLTLVGAGIRAPFHHSNMAKFQRSFPKCNGYLGIVILNGRSGDQRTMPEMWLSPCVGISSRKNVRGAAPTTFQRWLILSHNIHRVAMFKGFLLWHIHCGEGESP
jgi:hypothetical protein